MNEIDHLLTGDACRRELSTHFEPRYVRWEECAVMRSNYKRDVATQFEKVDDKIETNQMVIECKIETMNKELCNKIDANNTATGNKLDSMNTNLLGVSNSLVIAGFTILGSVIIAFVGFYLLVK